MQVVGHPLTVGHAGNWAAKLGRHRQYAGRTIGLVQLGENETAHPARLKRRVAGTQFAPTGRGRQHQMLFGFRRRLSKWACASNAAGSDRPAVSMSTSCASGSAVIAWRNPA